ncbi:MAG: hypothetical protein V3U90_04895 [Dehalococcoidia bacterium]
MWRALVGLVILALVVASCGGEPKTGVSPEEALREIAETSQLFANEGKWATFYGGTLSPRYREVCDYDTFVANTLLNEVLLRKAIGLEAEAPLEWVVVDVAVDGREGRVWRGLVLNGEVAKRDTPDRWVLLDKEWWLEPEGWEQGC